jgi:hypothetical protein
VIIDLKIKKIIISNIIIYFTINANPKSKDPNKDFFKLLSIKKYSPIVSKGRKNISVFPLNPEGK